MNLSAPLIFTLAALASLAPPSFAKDEVSADGVKVDKMSSLRNLVSEEELEAAAVQQYNSIKQQATQHRALAPDDHPQVQRLRKIAKDLIPHAVRWNERAAQWKWEVNLIGSKEINAFCMPGGKIAFFNGIITDLKLTDDEAAIVMGHEIAHALREHGRERAAKSGLASAGAKIAGLGLSAFLGIDPNLAGAATGGLANLTMLKFSRDDETEADLVGLDIVARAGYDPRAGVALWRKMGMVSKSNTPQWFSTHPAGKSRIAEMERHLPSVMPLYAKVKGVQPTALPPYQTNVKDIAPIR
ncbi:M48 family metallopeptidase [Noviherbaspirillum sp. Root189]|uniref:M48 family metallopeptidase n=1 Tax=Noviherbaspirillum sp. Root189 TaxID=1736487 RepID=UPI00070B814F|nr:M48 family metallopeptidase [Noviherbaspirillum sp. Root189]KRB79029.1 peptidase M48 [Noviherbaspirillum sp. Root189]